MTPRFDLSKPVPLLILGDGPCQRTGLGRISHDLCRLLSTMPEFKVGHLGRQAFGRASFPWQQYSFSAAEQWGEGRLVEAFNDLAGGAKGIIFTVWDASRLLWFAQPEGIGGELGDFLRGNRFARWGYFMQDSAGVAPNLLPYTVASVMVGYDRALLASEWAYQMAARTIQHMDIDWMPHGLNLDTFQPYDRLPIRSAWGIKPEERLLGCVMSNQERKSWPVVFETLQILGPGYRLWMHPDRRLHYWNLDALMFEYGVTDRVISDNRPLTDTELALRYSACDATLLISGGEGFCYPAAESMACGTPVIAGAYGAQFDMTWIFGNVTPAAYHIETQHNSRMALYQAADVAEQVRHVVDKGEQLRTEAREAVGHMEWRKLQYPWMRWLRKGLAQ